MLKAKRYDWKETNMALFGSDTEKMVKKESAESEPAWKGAGVEVGTQIWRIEKKKVTHWPKEQTGEFFSGDSYIVLNTFKEEESDELNYDVHFWIGKYSTQDEYGTAAYKTVELDTFLDDKPIQHREVQGHESAKFKSYFESLKLLKGGCDTGFNRVLPEAYKPRLFRVKKEGRNKIICTEISMKKGNLRKEDVFIIDVGKHIYQWNGSECTGDEKFKAAQEVDKMESKRSNSKSDTIEDGRPSENHPVIDLLFSDGESKKEEKVQGERKMFEVTDEDGSISMDLVAEGSAISKDLLKTENVYIINTGDAVFCWVGIQASIDERKNGMSYACNYISGTKTPLLPVTVVSEGRTCKEFDEAF